MYRRPKFLEILLDIRQQMARAADYDVDLFVEKVRSGTEDASEDAPSTEIEEPARRSDRVTK